MNNKNNILDLQFSTPNTDFASFLSMIPSAYTSNFKSVNTKGSFSIKAAVKGLFNDSTFPAFNVDLTVDDAYFKYPDLVIKKIIRSSISDLICKGVLPKYYFIQRRFSVSGLFWNNFIFIRRNNIT